MIVTTMPAFSSGYANAIAAAGGLQGRVLWCDAEANVFALDTREKVADVVSKCKEANINTIVVDVKPISGLVMYKSRIAPGLKTWRGKPYPDDYDLLSTMVEEGHRAGVEVHAAINVFSEGAAKRDDTGPAFSHPEWQCIKYEIERWARGSGPDAYPVSAVNLVPSPGRLALITEDKSLPADVPPDMVRVALDGAGNVVAVATGTAPQPFTVPPEGYVLAATGQAAEWLSTNAAGGRITIEGRTRFIPVGRAADQHLAVFVNPIDPQVRAYELSIISEIVSNYDVDGVMLDRMRYPGIYADFSESSRLAFESWLGEQVERFPEDIFAIDPIPGRPVVRGKHFGRWMEWRARQIRDFMAEARRTVKSAKSSALVGVYVGSWYGSYYDVGVNWAGPSHEPPYDFAGPGYKDTGYADLVDWMCTGCYYERASRDEARAAGASEWASVEAACQESIGVVEDQTFVYGSLYLLQYARNPSAFERAIETCLANTQGVMLFDLVYLRNYNWWEMLKPAFPQPAKAPHSAPGLVEKVREVRQIVEESLKRE
ncbi:MAG: family 10 glycosylhydrolase [Armatimonadetes bacterium]|nr:family 10 glycosylhydrolase [Armatimonadota bacterium]